MDFEPLSIVGIITEEVGSPTTGSGRGGGLYAVPLRLSRPVEADEADLLARLWDQPPTFSTMHRPGIGHASGDRFVLDGTTVDEVATYHAETLRAIVGRFNIDMVAARRREKAADKAVRLHLEDHRRYVKDVAKRIRFE